MRRSNLICLLTTTAFLSCPIVSYASEAEEGSFEGRVSFINPSISSMPENAAAQFLRDHVPIALEEHPDLYHQVMSQSFQDAFKRQYTILAELNTQKQTIEETENPQLLLDELQKLISQSQADIANHSNILGGYKSLRDEEETIKKTLNATILEQEKILSEIGNPSTTQEKTSAHIAVKMLEDAKKQLEILSIPLSTRETKLKLLNAQVEECKATSLPSNRETLIDELDQKLQKEHELLADFMKWRVSPIYSNVSFLDKKKGSMFTVEDPKRLLEKLLPLQTNIIDQLDSQLLWEYFVPSLELPDSKFSSTALPLQEAYTEHVAKLITTFEERLKEDIFCFKTISGMLESFNENAAFNKKPQLEVNIQEFIERQREINEQFNLNDLENEPYDKGPSLAYFKQIFNAVGISSDNTHVAQLLNTPSGLLGRFLESIERGGFYSWQSNIALMVKAQSKLRRGEDVSQELMQSFYVILARTFNKAALELIHDDIKPQSLVVPIKVEKPKQRPKYFLPKFGS
jgi:hypothetical protein